MIRKLMAEQARRTIDPAALEWNTTAEAKPLMGIVGQQRAVSALQFGLGIQDNGFNIYVSGPAGIGKMTAVESFLTEVARKCPTPPDWCYVNNFDDPYQPRVLSLPPGRGRYLQQCMNEFIADARREIPKAFESEQYTLRRDEIRGALNKEREQLLTQFGERASKAGFALEATPLGIAMIPTKAGRPLSEQEFSTLAPAEREQLQARHRELEAELDTLLKRGRELERAARDKALELDKQVTLYVVGGLIQDLVEKFRDLPPVLEFIEAVKRDMLKNIEVFKSGQASAAAAAAEELPFMTPWVRELPFRKYQVNVLVDASSRGGANREGAPVIVELNPNYNTLFGRIEKETHFGALYTDHTMIKAGALQRANGGFLVLSLQDLLLTPYGWEGLKHALRAHQIEIEDLGDRLGILTTKSLRPQPIPFQAKVVLIGRPLPFYLLHAYDEDFAELFKVQADFDSEMELTPENIADFASFIRAVCEKEGLKHLTRDAVAALLEQAVRLASDQRKLSTHFGALADVIREANYLAEQAHSTLVDACHIRAALEQRVYRANLIETRIEEMILRGTLVVATAGTQVGQVNGLSLLSMGNYMFGRPNRISASVAPGREGIVDIEREVALGGPIHSKGVLILSGYLARTFARDLPLSLAARLVFEQSYEGVEGDSASSAELYALLSALSDVPLKQNIAVTGSLDQLGRVQAIGGVNEKIEGFFMICRARGLTGDQGVIIPASNVHDLMLRHQVVEAMRENKFHLWAVDTVEEGIELLTGIAAGERDAEGNFPPDSLYARVARRLSEFALSLKRVSDGSGNGKVHANPVAAAPHPN